jgi:transaldolase
MNMTESAIARLDDLGQSPWYDNLARPLLTGGGLQQLVDDDGIRGVTSNPTILDKAIGAGDGYDEQLADCARRGLSIEDTYWEVVLADIVSAADLLRPVYDAQGRGDGFVSVEVAPTLAHDTDGTIAAARSLFARVDRPNVMIKIPATEAGIPAIAATLAAGINVNITLIFGLDRYAQVINAFFEGFEQRIANGDDVARLASVASFFVSRVDTETDRRLPEGHPLRGKAAVANARLAYQRFLASFAGPRWDALKAKGARVQRPLWASTSTKNPAYSPTLYVDTLIGRDTVNTLAQASIDALAAGEGDLRPDTVLEGVDDAHATMAGLAEAGIDFDEVTATLEREGVESFIASFEDAIATLAKKARELS